MIESIPAKAYDALMDKIPLKRAGQARASARDTQSCSCLFVPSQYLFYRALMETMRAMDKIPLKRAGRRVPPRETLGAARFLEFRIAYRAPYLLSRTTERIPLKRAGRARVCARARGRGRACAPAGGLRCPSRVRACVRAYVRVRASERASARARA